MKKSNGAVKAIPNPEIVHTYQVGSVYKINRLMLDGDLYYSKFQNAYMSYLDPATSTPIMCSRSPGTRSPRAWR